MDEAETMFESENVACVFFGPADSEEIKTVEVLSKKFLKVHFYFSDSAELMEYYDIKDKGFILFKQFDEGRNDFEGKMTFKNLDAFIHQNMFPII